MSWLTKTSMEQWFALLPEDVASCMAQEDIKHSDQDEDFSKRIEELKSGQEILSFILSNADAIAEFGRPKRIRFLAWIASRDYPDVVQALQAITDDERAGSGGAADGSEKVAPLFLSDIRALVEALGPRVAASIVDASTLTAIRHAGFEVANEFEMTSGGAL